MKKYIFAAIFALLALAVGKSVFVVDERERALVVRFGKVQKVISTPGINFMVPMLDEVSIYDGRIQSIETASLEVTALDDRRLVVDAFARWRITDLVQFRQAVPGGDKNAAEQRLNRILNAALRQVLGSVGSNSILSSDRASLMARIRDVAITEASSMGVEVVDVRIKRADLPTQNLKATFERMKAEREREAEDERARGREAAQRVRATAEREAVEIVSEARKQSEIIRGEADATRNAVFAEAFGRDPEFFAFYRSLRAYENAFQSDNSQMVITPDGEFFEYLKSNQALPQQ